MWMNQTVLAALATMRTEEPTTTTTQPDGADASLLTNTQAFDAAIWALGFGLAAIAAVLLFLFWDRYRSFRILKEALERGQTTGYQGETAISGAAGPPPGEAQFGPSATRAEPELEIVGLDTIPKGSKALYQVPGGDTSLHWEAAGDAILESNSGPKIHLTATGAGIVILTAKPIDGLAATKTITVPAGSDSPLAVIPFLGMGYGTVIIALAVVSVTATLGLTSVLQGQAVATILGSLITYTVARGVQSKGEGDGD